MRKISALFLYPFQKCINWGTKTANFPFQTAAGGWVREFSHVKDPNGRTAVFFAKINTFQTMRKEAPDTLWNAASRYLHANLPKGTKTLPISEWEKEYATLSGQRTAEYTKLKETRAEVAELHNIRKCVDIALKADQPEQTRAKRHDLER